VRRVYPSVLAITAAASVAFSPAHAAVPYLSALDAAAVTEDRLDNIMENSLILGNGDINGILYSSGPNLILRLTKNDVWDARVDTSEDPPLLKIDIKGKKLDGPLGGPIPSWDKPYPCPRACAHVIIGQGGEIAPSWRQIRAEGDQNSVEFRDGAAVMSIEGRAEASNGYAFEPLNLATGDFPTLRVRLSGTSNARFYIDVMSAADGVILGSKWIDMPTASEERTFNLPPGNQIGSIVLYTWTTDGKRAENRFESVTFEGADREYAVDLSRVTAAGRLRARLDIRRAVARVENLSGPGTGVPPAEVRALAQRNVFLISTPASVSIVPVPASYLPKPKTGEAEGVKWITQELPGDPDWPGMGFAVALARKPAGPASPTTFTYAVAIITSLESKDFLNEAVRFARVTAAADRKTLLRQHEKEWEKFWSASEVQLDDKPLTDIWYRNLYFMRCVSKPGVEAIGLYAGLTNDNPPWHGSHTLNYNSEQTFWTCYVTNHVEMAEPYERMIFRYLPRARWFARETYGCGGAHLPHNVFTHEIPDPEKCKSRNQRMHAFPPFAYTIGVSGFAVQNLWWHYKYQPDRKYLENIAYPAVRDVATFYADFMDRCETDASGKVILAPSFSPEHWSLTPDFRYNRNCTFDIAFAAFTFRAAIEGAAALGRDADLAARFRTELGRLPDYPTSKEDDPIVVDVLDAPPIEYNIAIPVVPVFPGEQVTWFSGEAEKKLFTRTIERVAWNGYNSSIIMSLARARMSLPGTWEWIKKEMQYRSRPNGTLTLVPGDQCGHFTEQFPAATAVSELLLQSVGDIIRVFPAWPKEKAGSFKNLRAQGGFLVSARQADGGVKEVEIISTVGGRLRMLSPWPKASVRRGKSGKAVPLAVDDRGIAELDTKAGERLVMRGGN